MLFTVRTRTVQVTDIVIYRARARSLTAIVMYRAHTRTVIIAPETYLPCARPQSKLPRLFTVRGRTS